MNPELFYYDVLISNLNNTNISTTQAEFSETRQQAYLLNPSIYKLSVVRWTADTQSLPIFRCQIQPNQGDPLLSIYSISLTYKGTTIRKYMEFVSQNRAVPIPSPPNQTLTGFQDNSTLYYDVYNYSYIGYLFNLCFKSAFEDLQVLYPLDLVDTFPPSFSFDADKLTFILYCDSLFYSSDPSALNQIAIYFNPATANLFNSFPFTINKLSDKDGKNYQLQTDLFQQANIQPFPPTNPLYDAITIYQEYSTVQNFNPVMAIVMTSTSLPIQQNATTGIVTASEINGVIVNTSNYQNNLVYPILTDFVADGIYKPNITYNPSAEYRRIQLIGSTALSNLDIQLYWRDRLGAFNNFILAGGATITIKLLFELEK
jgi:hypothetical protein